MKLPLVYYGNPLLRKKCEPVTKIDEEILRLIEDMKETLLDVNGLGLSAPQVGKSLNLFITAYYIQDEKGHWKHAPIRVFINPKLTNPSEETWIEDEGCLSIPKIYDKVERPFRITVTAQNEKGETFTEEFSEWPAKTIMHENDHINGVLFIDRLPPKRRKALDAALRKIKQKYNP